MSRRLIGCIGVLVLCVTAFGRGAGKSDVADAAMDEIGPEQVDQQRPWKTM